MRTDLTTINTTTASNAVAFTGHRTIHPDHLTSIKEFLSSLLSQFYDLGFRDFFCGMAIGFDLLASETLVELKKSYPEMRLIAVIPFKDQEKFFSPQDKDRYKKVLETADQCICLSEHYYRNGYRDRNQYMIDNCDNVIAYFDGQTSKSGTAQTIRMAYHSNKPVINIYSML